MFKIYRQTSQSSVSELVSLLKCSILSCEFLSCPRHNIWRPMWGGAGNCIAFVTEKCYRKVEAMLEDKSEIQQETLERIGASKG